MDDGDCPLFPNFYEFCTSTDGLNIQPPYPRQMGLIMQLLGEYCPRCSFKGAWDIERIPRKASAKSIKKNITFLEFGRCPNCGVRKHKLFKKGEMNMYDEMDLVLGQRSGKSSLLYSMVAPYQLHRWLKLAKPQETMGMLASTPLVGTFCAQTFEKAQELLFQPFSATIAGSQWFVRYHEILRHHEENTDRFCTRSARPRSATTTGACCFTRRGRTKRRCAVQRAYCLCSTSWRFWRRVRKKSTWSGRPRTKCTSLWATLF